MAITPQPESFAPYVFSVSYAAAAVLAGDADLIADCASKLQTLSNADGIPAIPAQAGMPPRMIMVGVSGDLAVTYANGVQDTIRGIPAGTRLALRVKTLRAAGSTVQQITAFW